MNISVTKNNISGTNIIFSCNNIMLSPTNNKY